MAQNTVFAYDNRADQVQRDPQRVRVVQAVPVVEDRRLRENRLRSQLFPMFVQSLSW